MKTCRFQAYFAGAVVAAGAFLWGGCESGAPVRSEKAGAVPSAARRESSSSQAIPTYEGFARGEWSVEALDVPAEKMLSAARSRSGDPQFVWGAAELTLASRELAKSQRDEALGLLEGLADHHPESEAYVVRAVSHALRWPTVYAERAKKLIRTHNVQENALADYALAACDLAQNKDGEARAKLIAAAAKERFNAYELEALRASVRTLEGSGYSPFSARMVAFFRRIPAHAVWMSAMSRYYDDKVRRGKGEKDSAEMKGLFGALAAMGMKAKGDAETLDTELAAIQVAKRALLRKTEAAGMQGDAVAVALAQKEVDEIDTRRELLNEYLGRRNASFRPGTPQWKQENEWVGFFDSVLAKGEAEAIRTDRMIEGPSPLGRMRMPVQPEK
ncbi:MAG: hypothetical protein V2A58_08655 [Planctomycetota bacterium]